MDWGWRMDRRIDGGWTHREAEWNDGWLTDELTDRRMDVLMDRQDGWRMDGRVDAWMNRHRRRDGWTDRWIPLVPPHTHTHTPGDFDCDRPFRAPPCVAHLKPLEERGGDLGGTSAPMHLISGQRETPARSPTSSLITALSLRTPTCAPHTHAHWAL